MKESVLQMADYLETNIGGIKEITNEKCKLLSGAIAKLNTKLSKLEKPTKTVVKNVNFVKNTTSKQRTKTPPSPSGSRPATSTCPPANETKPSSRESTSSATNVPKTEFKTKPKSVFLSRPKVLYVGDSVGYTASFMKTEKASNCRISTARAYSSVHDRQARWPEHNFQDVVKYALAHPGREEYDVLVMTAPTVDITNLDTAKVSPKDSTEVYQQMIISSTQNMFNTAQRSLEQNPKLKKVILMEHTPRFDSQKSDPTSIKANLVRIANATLGQLWLNSSFKNKIFIRRHSLESSGTGPAHTARYVNTYTGRYDGVHLFGETARADYTNSIKSILLLALPENQPTNVFGTAQNGGHQKKTNYQPNVQTSNRFSVFNSNNMGNF